MPPPSESLWLGKTGKAYENVGHYRHAGCPSECIWVRYSTNLEEASGTWEWENRAGWNGVTGAAWSQKRAWVDVWERQWRWSRVCRNIWTGIWGLSTASLCSSYPVIKSGEAPNGCASLPALSVTSSGTKYPGLKKKKEKRKERKGLIIWLEILIPEIKFYELPIAQHPIFLTFPVSHTVF